MTPDKDIPQEANLVTKKQGNIMIVALIAIFFVLFTNLVVSSMSRASAWEYKIESLNDFEFDLKMQKLGEEKWELVFARRALSDDLLGEKKSVYECIFKRPK